jgi:hypothetical protein
MWIWFLISVEPCAIDSKSVVKDFLAIVLNIEYKVLRLSGTLGTMILLILSLYKKEMKI